MSLGAWGSGQTVAENSKGRVRDSTGKKHSRGRDNGPTGKFIQAALTLAGQVK